MTYRTSITLDAQAYDFLMSQQIQNKSAYINRLLRREQEKLLEQAILKANQEESAYLDAHSLKDDWDDTLSDGLDNEA